MVRYALALLTQGWALRFPAATLLANLGACLVLGWVLAAHGRGYLDDRLRLLLAVGFCGGFSTFSTFTAESWQLWQRGHLSDVLLHLLLNVVGCWICFLAGFRWGLIE